jgi:hypothetical protein
MWPWSTIRRLRRDVDAYERDVVKAEYERDYWRRQAKALENALTLARRELTIARKNDNRDPKTGRFVRREADHIDE